MAAEEVDINVAFDFIAQTEERILADGFREGFESSVAEGSPEGFHLGYHKGAELGAELGFYQGVVETWIRLGPATLTDRAQQSLIKVLELLNKFPKTNVDTLDILAQADVIRASYRRACSHLKITAPYPESSKLTF